jgi:glutamate N-acetyltransferase/amino-acid N-acetyltransferase
MANESGGVCAARGFRAAGLHCGIRAGSEETKKDLSLIVSDTMCSAAGVYTTNKVKGAPLVVTARHLADGRARAVICNSGNANTCAPDGEALAQETCRLAGETLGIDADDVLVASTGVIGEALSIVPFEKGIPALVKRLSYDGGAEAAQGIMTTDTVRKETAVQFQLGGKTCTIGGMAKGSGMIHPNMATMLAFITTDACIHPSLLHRILAEDIKDTFNQLSVDGDTSTNDMVILMANGMAGNAEVTDDGEDAEQFRKALHQVTSYLVERLAADGEGAGKLIVCHVEGADTKDDARSISRSVVSSNLFKAAVFGEDANWGRVLCAIGYADGDFSTENIDVVMRSEKGSLTVCRGSRYFEHSEEKAAEILSADAIHIDIDMHSGEEQADAWGCDLTYDYVRINGDYRS